MKSAWAFSQTVVGAVDRNVIRGSEREKHTSARPAFTLLELLIVIAIIAILAAILLPVLSRGKANAYRVQCASNLHQIGVALQLYVDEFHCYPLFGWSQRPPVPPDPRSVYWDYKILGYAGENKGLFLCPAVPVKNRDVTINWSLTDPSDRPVFGRVVWPNRSYGYNAVGVGLAYTTAHGGHDGGTGGFATATSLGLSAQVDYDISTVFVFVKESKVVIPADMIAAVDYDPTLAMNQDGNYRPPTVYEVTLTGQRHNDGANGVFCDAHVEYAKIKVWRAAGSRQRWNYDHDPNPTAIQYLPW